jgi:hypothetical protein
VTIVNLHDRANQRKEIIIACGRLADAKKWFASRGWDVLPQGERGERILDWGADHAYSASPDNPTRSVRNWCRRWAPWLKDADLARLLARTVDDRNKRWSPDQCAAVLEITVRDREFHGLRFIGADDDPNYKVRLELKQLKAATRSRRYRARKSIGGKRGRPALSLSPEEKLERTNAQAAERMRRHRALRKNASRHISNIDSVTEFSVTAPPVTAGVSISPQAAISGAPEAPQRLAPIIEEIVVDRGVGLMPPPTHLELYRLQQLQGGFR